MVQCADILHFKIPKRLIVGIMAFFACFVLYLARVNISVAIVPMSLPLGNAHKIDPECKGKTSTKPANATNAPPQNYGPRYDWDQVKQGHILASFTYGYILTQVPGGVISEMFGARLVIFVCCIAMGVTTILTPLASQWHYIALCGMRAIMGLGAGAVYPALHTLISRWAPPAEKNKFIWSLLGGNIGTVVTFSVIGVLVPVTGWPFTFYLSGGIILIYSLLWLWLIRNTPSSHNTISPEELEYIMSSLGGTVSNPLGGGTTAAEVKKKVMPIKSIATSIPFLTLILLHFGNLWGLFFIITEVPKYTMEVLGYNLKASGFLSALPSLARVVFGFFFSAPADYLIKKEIFSKTCIRKSFTIFSHVIPGALMVLMGFIGCNSVLSVAVLTLILGFNGAATVTNLANHHDLAPNFAGSLFGIMNMIGTTTGFIIPIIVGAILKDKHGLAQWRIIFLIGGVIFLLPAALFIVLGSTKLQSWNTPKAQGEEPPR